MGTRGTGRWKSTSRQLFSLNTAAYIAGTCTPKLMQASGFIHISEFIKMEEKTFKRAKKLQKKIGAQLGIEPRIF